MQAYGLPRRGRPARAGRRAAEDCRGPRRNEPAATWRKRMDPLFCGKNTSRKTCHRPVRWDGPFGPILKMETERPLRRHSVSGGGGWIRTIEGKASRFTVCPLWPLGYSSIFSWAEEGGAGGRIRTPDLLITNQLLYQLSYTSTAASAFTTMMIITAGGGFVNRFFKKEQKNERMEEPRQEKSGGRTGSSGAACAGGSCTPATPTSPWRAGRCVSTAWGGMPGAISPPSFAGWGGARLRRARTLFEKRSRENDL